MNRADVLSPDLAELLNALLEGDIDSDRAARLEQMICSDPAACRLYLKYVDLHVELKRRYVAAQVSDEDVEAIWNQPELFGPDDNADARGEVRGSIGPISSPLVDPSLISSDPQSGRHPPLLTMAYHGTIGFFSQEIPFALLIATVITSLGLLAGSLIYVTHHTPIASDGQRPATPVSRDRGTITSDIEFVGRVTGMIDAKWLDINTSTELGNGVPLGRRYALASGLMEITYDTGAKVILQGPVTYEVDSRRGGFLSIGKLTARLEKRGEGRGERGRGVASGQWLVASKEGAEVRGQGAAVANHKSEIINHKSPVPALTLALSQRERGPDTNLQSRNPEIPKSQILNPSSSPVPVFAVRTPTAVVTDLGTEFGVNVLANHAAEICVFDGKVEVAQTNGENASKASAHPLIAGEAMRVEPAGNAKSFSAHDLKTSFVRKMPLAPRAPSGLQQGLVAYWSFDDAAHLGKNLTGGGDLTPTGTVSHEAVGLIGGALCLSQDAKNDTLLFADGRGVPKGVPTGEASYSISAWCRVDAVPANKTFDIVGWGEATVDRANALILFGNSSEQCMVRNFWWNNDIAGFVGTSSMQGKWHHVVTTYDRRGRMQYLYLDRDRIELRGVENRPNVDSNNFAIGRRHPHLEPNVQLEWFGGLLDEIGIWNRELSEKEVAKLYNSGKGLNPLTLKNALEENAGK